MSLLDIHTHSLRNAQERAIVSLSLHQWDKLSAALPADYFSVGVHPWEASEFTAVSFVELEQYIQRPQVLAVGECGLDKHSSASIELQVAVFEKHVSLSEQYQKPLIIHCVGCFNELIAMKKKIQPHQPWIVHGFRGKPQLTKQLLDAGMILSFGSQFNRRSVELTPIDSICLETDEDSVTIQEVYQSVADIKSCDVADLNLSEKLFGFR